jgi:hypothetical protein
MADEQLAYGFSADDASALLDLINPTAPGDRPVPPIRHLKSILVRATATARVGDTLGSGTGRLLKVDDAGAISNRSPDVDLDIRSQRLTAITAEVLVAVREQVTNEWIVC